MDTAAVVNAPHDFHLPQSHFELRSQGLPEYTLSMAYEISDRFGQTVAILVFQKLTKTALEISPIENSGFVSNPRQAALSLIRNSGDIGSRYSP